MDDLQTLLEQAIRLLHEGRPEQALEIGTRLLGPSRGTPHAAAVHRHQAEFLLASGRIDAARQMAEEAGRLARATRHPGEILAATLAVLSCDLNDGQVAAVHLQLSELLELAPRQALPQAFMGEMQLLVGAFEDAVRQCGLARGLLAEQISPGDPGGQMRMASLLYHEAVACMRLGEVAEAGARLERLLGLDPCPEAAAPPAEALSGLLSVEQGHVGSGLAALDAAVSRGRAFGSHTHGQCLLIRGRARMEAAQRSEATEDLRLAVGLLLLPLARQEGHLLLGRLAHEQGQGDEARRAFQRATEPSTDTYFGRRAVQALHRMVGLKAV